MTFLNGRSLPRRTVLRGLGATLALPLLEAMLPASSRRASAAGRPAHRFLAFYVPNGMAMEYWTPKGDGRAFELSPILRAAGTVQEPDAGAVGHQRQLELHPCRRLRVVPDRHDSRREKRSRDPGGRVDGPVAGQALRQRDAAGVSRARHGCARQRRCVHGDPELRLHAHDRVAQPDAAVAHGVQPARGLRAAVRRQRQHGKGRARGQASWSRRACSTR